MTYQEESGAAMTPLPKSEVTSTDSGKDSAELVHALNQCRELLGRPPFFKIELESVAHEVAGQNDHLYRAILEQLSREAFGVPPAAHLATRFEPLDLDALMASDPPEESWSVEPLLPEGKLTGVISKRGDGKSLLLLEMAIKKATGEAVLDQPAASPIHALYLDQEMGPSDLYDRIVDLGYDRDHPRWRVLVEHLHYYQLIALPPLNTAQGGQALEELVDRHGAKLVVIDTLSRVVTGSENDAEPYQELFRHTESRLKAREITLARLDHLGKDTGRGSRGSSAKEDGLDVIWQMEINATGSLQLTKTKGRAIGLPDSVTIHWEQVDGVVSHRTDTELTPEWLLDLVGELDRVGVPVEAGSPTAQKMLREAGVKKRRADIVKAVRFRKRQQTGTPSEHPSGTSAGTPWNTPIESAAIPSLFDREHLREHPGTGLGGVFPTIGGNTPDPALGEDKEEGDGEEELSDEEAYRLIVEAFDATEVTDEQLVSFGGGS